MDSFVFAAVLFAATCHAGWNTLIKGGTDPLLTTTLIAVGAGLVALVLAPFAGIPAVASWPWLLASTATHVLYFTGLIESYRTGDLGQVYPLARGSAPLMTATVTTTYLGEKLTLLGWIGIAALVAGVLLLSLKGGRDLARIDRRAVLFALFTALTICAYSVFDGVGGRLSGNPHAYTVWLFVACGIVMLPYALLRGGGKVMPAMTAAWRRGILGGGMQVMSYGIAIWAMTVAPIAVIAALRETSVLFGSVIAVVILKEPLRAMRVVAAVLIVAGLAAIRFQ